MTQRTYAQDTNVSVDKSTADVKKMLKALGADRIAVIESSDGNFLAFQHGSVAYKLTQPKLDIPRKSEEQCDRAAWRAIVLLVKAKKVAIDQGITTLEREFFSDTMLPDGTVLGDHHKAIVGHNYTDGPPLLGGTP